MKTGNISLVTALLGLTIAPAAVAQVGPDAAYFEIDGDYGSVFSYQAPVHGNYLEALRITDGEDPYRQTTYAPKQGVRIDNISEPACTDWYHISDSTYMGARAYRVQAIFDGNAPNDTNPRRSEQMLLKDWYTGPDSARYFTFAFRFNPIGPLEQGSGYISQWHHGGSGQPPVRLLWGYENGGYYLEGGLYRDSPTDNRIFETLFKQPATPGAWYRMLFQVDPGQGSGRPDCLNCPGSDGTVRAWMMIPQTGQWELLREHHGQIGHHYIWDSDGNRTDRTGNQLSYQWKVGHYVNETDWISLDYDNVAYGKRWNNITKNRLIGYKKSVLNLKFDEGTGPVANDDCWSWNGGQQGDVTMDYDNDGTVVGAVARSNAGVGFWRRSLYFTGGYVSVPIDPTDFDFGNYVTVSAWFQTTASAVQTQALVSIDSDGGIGKLFLSRGDDRLSFGVRHPDGTYSEVIYNHTPKFYTDGRWHHVVGTFNRFTGDNRRVKLYVDGVRVLQREGFDKPILRGDTSLFVGRLGNSGGFDGHIDEVNVLNYTMTDAEVAALTSQTTAANTRVWDGGSPSTGTWTADTNWEGNVRPGAGDFLIFPAGAARLTNTNTFGGDTVFGGIIFQGDNYDIHGNPITLTNHITAELGASGNTFRPDIRLGAEGYLRARGSGLQLTFLGDIDLDGHDLSLVCQSGQLNCGGVISGAGHVTKSGNGRAMFSGIAGNTFSGTTYVMDGILDLSKYITINPGAVRMGRLAIPGNLVIGLGTSSLISDAVVCNANNQIATTAQVTVNATGELNLNHYNNTISSLRMAGGHVTSGNGMLTVSGNIVVEADEDGSVISGNLNLGPGGKKVILNNDAQLTIAAVVSGPVNAPLEASGGGDLRLTANNTYAGQTMVHSGAIRVNTPGGLGTGDTVTIADGELTLANTAITGKTLRALGPGAIISEGSCAWNGDVVVESDLFVNTGTGSTLVWPGQVSGSGGFTKGGAGVLRLSGPVANTFTGGVLMLSGVMELYKFFNGEQVPAISGSTLSVGDTFGGPGVDVVRYGGPGQIGDTTFVRVSSSGRVQLAGWTDLIGALFGSSGGEVDLGLSTARWIVGGNPSSTTYAGTFTGSGSLVKTGAATLTLTGNSTYLNNFTVAQGTLLMQGRLLAGSTNSILQVHGQGTLGGTGHVDNVTIFPGGKLAPGAGAGRLSVSNLWFNPAGRLSIELNGRTPGVGYDCVIVSGAITNYPNGGVLEVVPGFVPAVGDSFLILDKKSPGPVFGTFNALPQGALFAVSNLLFRISYTGGDGNDVVLTRAAAPASSLSGLTSPTKGHLEMRGFGVSNLVYTIEATTNLNSNSWNFLGTTRAGAGGEFRFTETNTTAFPMRFYRVLSP